MRKSGEKRVVMIRDGNRGETVGQMSASNSEDARSTRTPLGVLMAARGRGQIRPPPAEISSRSKNDGLSEKIEIQ